MSHSKKARKRGVRASRTKLTQALLSAGLKTQSSLAERIAQVESLESAPKDLVNRVFRQQPVDPNTLERIAAALGVTAHQLYLSSDEPDYQESPPQAVEPAPENESNIPQSKRVVSRKLSFWSLIIGVCLSALVLAMLWRPASPTNKPTPANAAQSTLAIANSVIIYSGDDQLTTVADHLGQFLPTNVKHTHVAKQLVTPPISAPRIADQFQSDGVITLNLLEQGRYQFTQLYYYINGEEKQLASLHHTNEELLYQPERLARQLSHALAPLLSPNMADNRATNLNASGEGFTSVNLDLAEQKSFLNARLALQQVNSELAIKRAQTLLANILALKPEFYLADAAMCEALIHESWMGNEKLLLQRAQKHCDLALSHLAKHPYVAQAQGLLLRRTGEVPAAIELLSDQLQIWPNHSDLLRTLSYTELVAYQQAGKSQKFYIDQAIEHAEQAVALVPEDYHAQFDLSIMYQVNYQYEKAIAVLQKALSLEDTIEARSNLTMAYFCNGQPDLALSNTNQVSVSNEQSYIKEELLGQAYYFSGDFSQAEAHRQRALDIIGTGEGGWHQQWGNLADTQRHLGDKQTAIDSYRQAMTIVARDELRGNLDVQRKIFYAYYYQMLSILDPLHYPAQDAPYTLQQLTQLLKENVEVASFFRLAVILKSMDQTNLASEARNTALNRCPGYSLNPDYKSLTD